MSKSGERQFEMKKWKLKNLPQQQPNLPEYPAFVLKLLNLRSLFEAEEIRGFLEPEYYKLHDPFLFREMEKTVERVKLAITNQEKITIYADYDADAITAASVVFLALKKLGAVIDCYIPDRFAEGYGVNSDAVKKIAESGSKLIITVDCGTNSVAEAKLCQELGIDLIVTDHHEVTGELPGAYALINPKNPTDNYPFRFLTGVGVAYKLVQALFSTDPNHPRKEGQASNRGSQQDSRSTQRILSGNGVAPGWEKWLLDLVAIGTVADCQSLTGENRILVSFGLKVLAKTRWLGIRKLLDVSQVSKIPFDTFTLGFILAPRINAAGRIKHADLAFKLLVSEDEAEAGRLALELNDLNKQRQTLTEQVLSEAREQLSLMPDKKILLAYGADWPKGVVGLVAGKLVEEYGRPVLILRKEELLATGSGRSIGNFDLVAALNSSKDLLVRFGGHTQAAGFTFVSEHIPSFHQKLLEYVETVSAEFEPPVLEVDCELAAEDITAENYAYIKKMAPFGVDNPKPKFVSCGMEVVECRTVGNGSKHLKMRLKLAGKFIGAIAFGQGFLSDKLVSGTKIDAVYELEENSWKGNTNLELKIVDIKL